MVCLLKTGIGKILLTLLMILLIGPFLYQFPYCFLISFPRGKMTFTGFQNQRSSFIISESEHSVGLITFEKMKINPSALCQRYTTKYK